MGRANNFPQGQLDNLPADANSKLTASLKQLHDLGRPQTDSEVRDRIDLYFEFCEKQGLRPGIEGMCLSLHITRTTLFNWSRGIGCSIERQQTIESAKAFISCYLEQILLAGRISPPSAIFLLKNWCSYRDTLSLEDLTANERPKKTAVTAAELPKFGVEVNTEESNSNDTYEGQYDYLLE